MQAFIFMILVFFGGKLYLLANSFQNSLLVDKISLYSIIAYLLILQFKDSKTILEKVAWIFPIIWVGLSAYWNIKLKLKPGYNIIDRIDTWVSVTERSLSFNTSLLSGIMWLLTVPIIICGLYFLLNRISKILNVKSDKLNDTDIFILLKKPETNSITGALWSFFTALPITHLWAISKGYDIEGNAHIYTYYFKKLGFLKGILKRKKLKGAIPARNYILLNTGIKAAQKQNELKKLLGEPWSLKNSFCFVIFLNSIGADSIFKQLKKRMVKHGS